MKNPMTMKPTALILTLMLGACSTATRPQPQPVHTQPLVSCPPAKGESRLGEFLRYYSDISALALPDAAKEYEAVSMSFSRAPDNAGRIKLAMLLSLPNTPFHNTAAALDLLQALPDQPADAKSGLGDLARLLAALLLQQRQADETVNDLGKALASEKMHSKSLQGKIDAIKAFEINQPHRDQP